MGLLFCDLLRLGRSAKPPKSSFLEARGSAGNSEARTCSHGPVHGSHAGASLMCQRGRPTLCLQVGSSMGVFFGQARSRRQWLKEWQAIKVAASEEQPPANTSSARNELALAQNNKPGQRLAKTCEKSALEDTGNLCLISLHFVNNPSRVRPQIRGTVHVWIGWTQPRSRKTRSLRPPPSKRGPAQGQE